MTYRFEFEEPLEKGRRRVRVYDRGECIMSGVLEPRRVEVIPARIFAAVPVHETYGTDWDEYRDMTGHEITLNEIHQREMDMRKAVAQLEKLVNQ